METPFFPRELFEIDFQNVYEPAEDTFLLIDSLEKDLEIIKNKNPTVCLEIGCGSGAVIASLAKALGSSCLYLATDVNPNAAVVSKKCFAVNGVSTAVDLVLCDLATPLHTRLHRLVDVLLFNPPYVPTSCDEVGGKTISASWAGGRRGREVIDRFLMETVPLVLSPNGLLYLIVIKENDVQEVSERMESVGFSMEVVLERKCGCENLLALRFARYKQE